MATANRSGPGIAPAAPTRRPGAQSRHRDTLAALLGDVRVWARHQRMPDLGQAMDDALLLAAEVRHG